MHRSILEYITLGKTDQLIDEGDTYPLTISAFALLLFFPMGYFFQHYKSANFIMITKVQKARTEDNIVTAIGANVINVMSH